MNIQLTEQEKKLLKKFDALVPVHYDFQAVQPLTRLGLLEIAEQNGDSYKWVLSRSAILYLESEKKFLHKKAEDKAQQRFENKISVLNLLIPLVTFALGVVVEHYVSIVDWFFAIFH